MSNFPSQIDLFFIKEFDNFAHSYIAKVLEDTSLKKFNNKESEASRFSTRKILTESMAYTLLDKTKRFRPLLIIYTAKSLNLDYKKVLPWALSIEMIHSFSLIHDDLPCMDDDDLRRGKASNHKVFGEALALLSGNSLLVEAFSVLLKHFSATNSASLCVSLMGALAEATGSDGMMLGQVGDLILSQKIQPNTNQNSAMSRKFCNELKTGALIKAAVLGVIAIYKNEFHSLDKAWEKQEDSGLEQKLMDFAFYLGRAFQWADDLVDKEGDASLVAEKLKKDSQKALQCLKDLPGEPEHLEHLIIANQTHFQ